MKKLIPLLLALAASGVHAQATPPATPPQGSGTPGLSGFMDKLRMKVERLTPQKKLGATTAVGGVRGAAVEASDVYWKSEAKPQLIDENELTAFQAGMTLVESDQLEPARAAFSSFIKTYPDSALKADATEMLKHLASR